MPRPKKAKVQLVAESGLTESTGITGSMQSEESTAAAHVEQEELTSEEEEEADDNEARQEANELVRCARAEVHPCGVGERQKGGGGVAA